MRFTGRSTSGRGASIPAMMAARGLRRPPNQPQQRTAAAAAAERPLGMRACRTARIEETPWTPASRFPIARPTHDRARAMFLRSSEFTGTSSLTVCSAKQAWTCGRFGSRAILRGPSLLWTAFDSMAWAPWPMPNSLPERTRAKPRAAQ